MNNENLQEFIDQRKQERNFYDITNDIPRETTNDLSRYVPFQAEEYAHTILSVGDRFIQNGYNSLNRTWMTMTTLPEAFKEDNRLAAGDRVMEWAALIDALENPFRPYIMVLGDTHRSVSEELDFLKKNAERFDEIFICGVSTGTFFRAMGIEIGAGYFDEELIAEAQEFLNKYGRIVRFASSITVVSQDGQTVMGEFDPVHIPEGGVPLTTTEFPYTLSGTSIICGYPQFAPEEFFAAPFSAAAERLLTENFQRFVNKNETNSSEHRTIFLYDHKNLGEKAKY